MQYSKVHLALLASLLMTGCLSDDDSNSETPTPTPPAPAPVMVSFAIQGIATDEPVANADITANIGSQSFSTQADSNGEYSLEFEYEEGSLTGDEMVVLTAAGADDQSHITLASQLGSLNALDEQAGDDGILSADESGRTSITQISTAMHLLALDTGIEISSDEDLEDAEAQIDAEELLELSSIIKVLADNPDFTPDSGTIIEILSQEGTSVEEALDTYLEDNGLLDENGEFSAAFESAVEAAEEATLSDPAVTSSFTADELVGTNVNTVSVTTGWVALSGAVWQFNADNTATKSIISREAYIPENDTQVSWSLDESGRIQADLGNNGVESYEYLTLDLVAERWGQEVADKLAPHYESGQLKVVTSYDSSEIIKLFETAAGTKVAINSEMQVTLDPTATGIDWEGELPSYSIDGQSVGIWHKAEDFASVWTEAPSGSLALPIVQQIEGYYDSEPQPYFTHVKITLAEGGVAQNAQGESFGQWSFTDNGSLELTSQDGWVFNYQPYDAAESLMSAVITATKGDITQTQINWIAEFDQASSTLEDDLVQTMPNILGAWINSWQAGQSTPDTPDFWTVYGYSFEENGNLSWTYATSVDISGYFLDVFKTYDHFQSWEKVEDHSYALSGEKVTEGWSTYSRLRNWTSIATLSDGRHLVLEESSRTTDYVDEGIQDLSGQFIFPRINVLLPIDISQFETVYQNSLDQDTIVGPIPEYKFDPDNFIGRQVYDVIHLDQGGASCEGFNTFHPFLFNDDGTGIARDTCNTGSGDEEQTEPAVFNFSYSFEQDNRVIQLTFEGKDIPEYIVAGPKAEDGKSRKQMCWISEADVLQLTNAEEALAYCLTNPDDQPVSFYYSEPRFDFDYFSTVDFAQNKTMYAVEDDCVLKMDFTSFKSGVASCEGSSETIEFDWQLDVSAQVFVLDIAGSNTQYISLVNQPSNDVYEYCWLDNENGSLKSSIEAFEQCQTDGAIDGEFRTTAP